MMLMLISRLADAVISIAAVRHRNVLLASIPGLLKKHARMKGVDKSAVSRK